MATVGPWHIDLNPWIKWKSHTFSSVTRVNYTDKLSMGLLSCTGFAPNVHIEWDVPLLAGTWTITVIHTTFGSGGTVSTSIDGSAVGSFSSYSAGETVNVVSQITGVAVAASGIKELRFTVTTPGDEEYSFQPQLITLSRTV